MHFSVAIFSSGWAAVFCSHHKFSISELKIVAGWTVVSIHPLSKYEIIEDSKPCGKSMMGDVPYFSKPEGSGGA